MGRCQSHPRRLNSDIQLFEQICSRILDEEMKVRNGAVVIENRATQELIYRPPTGYGNLIRLLTNLARFINDKADGLEPLVKMSVMHYQFEAIHPFMDGNGEIGFLPTHRSSIGCAAGWKRMSQLTRHLSERKNFLVEVCIVCIVKMMTSPISKSAVCHSPPYLSLISTDRVASEMSRGVPSLSTSVLP